MTRFCATCTVGVLFVIAAICPIVASAQGDVARELVTEHRIEVVVDEDAAWSDAELQSLARGASALPRAIIAALPRNVSVRRVRHACLFGIGRDSRGCPTYDDDGNFLIYDLPPLQGEGPVTRLAPLDEAQRADIQRRRAAVHAIMLAFDAEHEWSDEKRWRQISGWRTRRQAMNRDRWGFSRYLGARSPRLDFVTFAEAWFVRPEDVVPQGRRYTLDRDDSIACQEFTKSAYLAEKLAIFAPRWQPPIRTRLPPHQRCEAFEAWADMANLESIDVLVASATADRPESLYGHLLLHIRYAGRSEGFEPVYQFGAVTDTNVDPITYFSRGLFGGFLSVIELNSFRAVDRIFLQYEQRNLRRYQLMLSPVQKRRFMERLWEYERRYRYPYYFFSNNCASFLVDLIGPSLELDIPDRSHLIVAPTDVLDYLADVENPGYGALLRKRPEMEFSSREVAQHSVSERRDVLESLAASLDPQSAERLRALDEALDEQEPDERYTAYRAIGRLLRYGLREADAQAVRQAIDYLYLAGRMERYFAEVMFYRVREIRMNSLIDRETYTAEELLARRRELYATEDTTERYRKLLEWSEELQQKAMEGPHRELTSREQEDLELAHRTDEAFAAALDAQAMVIETFAPAFDGVAYLEARRGEFVEEQRRRDALAVGPSGKGRIALGGGAATTDDLGTVHGSVFGSYSFIWERLGAQRRRGFRSDIETRGLGIELHVPTTERFFENAQIDGTLLRFMTIEQKLGAVREGFFDIFGWGFDLGAAHDGRRGLDFGADVSGGLLLPVFTSDHVANHLVLGLWGDGQLDFTPLGRRSRLGADAFAHLLIHLGGVYANTLRLEIGSRHWFGFETVSWEFEHRARLATEHAMLWVGQYPLVLSPWIQGEWTSLDFLEEDRNFRTLRAGLSMELPL